MISFSRTIYKALDSSKNKKNRISQFQTSSKIDTGEIFISSICGDYKVEVKNFL